MVDSLHSSLEEDQMLLYYHFLRPFGDLDFRLFALGSDQDVCHLGTYVDNNKKIDSVPDLNLVEHESVPDQTQVENDSHLDKEPFVVEHVDFEMNLENEDYDNHGSDGFSP
uniref:Uncharacterized protein n=1 Tax=Lactuca sativa TaxID=4236 RepID=A0A9R1XMC1_LACSA|nr:hypothetical protein LSAT_V11C200070120 [Lactuca sativa]